MDKITFKILPDGTIKTGTDQISMPNHTNAERCLAQIFKLAGGTVVKKGKHAAAHMFGHQHSHGEQEAGH